MCVHVERVPAMQKVPTEAAFVQEFKITRLRP